TVLTVVAGVLVLAGLAIYLTLHQRAAPISFLVQNRKLVLLLEATFTLAFAVFVGIRYLNPDLWQPWFGGEKPMEFAFLNATLRSPTMPPYDPWFAGGYVNYYYFGQFIVAVLVKLVGVAPRFAFNLAVPTLFALAFVGIFSLGYDFTVARAKDQSRPLLNRAIVWGLVAAGFVVIAGNLDGLLQFLEIIRGSLAGQGLAGFDFWRSTRIIPGTINEFPFFTFLFADLHAHMVSLPITIVVLGLALNLVPRREDVVTEVPLSQGFSGMVRSVATLVGSAPAVSYILLNAVISALVLGALAVTNSWDFPTYLLILLGAMVLVAITRGTLRRRIILVVVTGVLGLVIATMSLGLYWPFFFYFKSFYSSVALERSHTDFPYYVVIFGLFLFVIISFLVHALARRSDRQVKEEQQNQLSSRPEKGDAPAGGELSCRPLTPVVEIPGAPTIETPGRFMASGHLFQSYESGGSELPRRAGQASSELPEPNRRADSTLAGISSSRLLPIGLVVLSVGALGFLATQGLLLAGFLAVLLVSLLFAACLRSSDPGERFVLLVIFAGLTVSLGVELFYLVDFLQGGDYHRMNTVFKFYNQVWVLLALGSALALSLLFGKVRELVASNKPVAARIAGVVWLGVLAALLVGVAIYPILGTNSRVQNRFPGEGLALSLDGLGYMATGKLAMRDGRQIDLAGDYDAIEWLLKNVKGTPVILEASIGPYRGNGSRIANNTGLPTPLGWDNHESQQRYPEQIAQRVQDVRTIYNTTDIDLAMSLLRRYRVKYVYVGQIERYTLLDQGHLGATTAGEPYASAEGLEKFDAAVGTYCDVVYSNRDVKIYQVRG
ncbi:MAG: DUF2298 domain-containing protein, partial [Chloroflexi bacterium]|nr:DUF2298 domain-containing protein [Chloroflexota bacterium]